MEEEMNEDDDLLGHYDFDYSKAKPNRFAEELRGDTLFVSVDSDVAAVIPTTESVNEALQLLITAAQNLPEIKGASPIKQGSIEAKPDMVETALSLEQLLEAVTEDNLHREVDTGFAVGNEAW
jgi:hypothetical protein